jgi:hypothetical protein
MFESDQHEFDDEYAEISHPAPPPASKPAASAVPAATGSSAAAVHEPIVEEQEEEQYEEPEEAELEEFVDPAERRADQPKRPAKKKPNVLLLGGFAALLVFTIFVVMTMNKPKDNTPPPGDLGPGIVAADGLRGHLETRWDGNAKTGRLVYKLQIVPMEDRWGAGFSHVVSSPPLPMSVNIRLLDSTGFALCGKEIDFPFDAQSAAVPVTVSAVGANGKKLSAAERNAAMQAARQSHFPEPDGDRRAGGRDQCAGLASLLSRPVSARQLLGLQHELPDFGRASHVAGSEGTPKRTGCDTPEEAHASELGRWVCHSR